MEIDQLKIERHKMHEVDAENERMQSEILRMTHYIQEQESGLDKHRERIRETEKSVSHQLEQQRFLEANLEKLKQEITDMKRTINA